MRKGIDLTFPKVKRKFSTLTDEIKTFLEKYEVKLIEYEDPVTGRVLRFFRRKRKGIWGKDDKHIFGKVTKDKVIERIVKKS